LPYLVQQQPVANIMAYGWLTDRKAVALQKAYALESADSLQRDQNGAKR
jgi:hypothetical protein